MSSATLEAIFVQRHKLVADLIESVRESAETANKHFRLLIGMRGIGKTHTIALTYHRLKSQTDLQDKLLIAWLKEEEWGVSSWLDLLLRIFKALEIEYPQDYQKTLQTEVESLYQLSSEDATSQAEKILKEFISDRTLLLLTENLDEIFNGLGNIGQKQFRAYLQNHNLITIIATSQSLFTGVSKKDSPFYGFFAPQYLDKLTIEEATNLLSKIAQVQEDRELESFIKSTTGKDRIQAIHNLTNGNHRVYIIFSQFLTRNSLDELVKSVMQTLDELTPYYQAKMQWLSSQQRKIIELLCDKGGRLSVKEIARRCFITHQTASSQLKDLLTKGYVTKESLGRESFYELQEPLMRICLEMKKQRGEPIKLLIDFLRSWYTEEELKAKLKLLPEYCLEREYIDRVLTIKENSDNLIFSAVQQAKGENWEEASELFYEAIKNDDRNPNIWYNFGVALDRQEKHEEAITCYEQVIKIKPDDFESWNNRGCSLFDLKRYDEAFTSYQKAIQINSNNYDVFNNCGFLLYQLRRYDEAIVYYQTAIEINPSNYYAWYNLGLTLYELKRYQEVITSYEQVITIQPDNYYVWFDRIKAIFQLNNWQEGFQELDDALNRFAHEEESHTGDTTEYIKIIWNSTTDINLWKSRLKTLVKIYDEHLVISALSKGIVDNIPNLMSEMVSDKLARTWLETWQSIVGDKPELSIALRLLKTAVEYKETKGDRRVLLKLAREEREILEPLVSK